MKSLPTLAARAARHVLMAATAALLVAACQSGAGPVPAPSPGDSRFLGAPLENGGGWLGDGAYGGRGEGTPSADPNAQGAAGADPVREIEEADIVKVQGTTLYALNQYRGLFIIDIANPDRPAILGHLDMYGYPVEMYVRDGRAYVVLTRYFRVWAGVGLAHPETEIGSAVLAVDVSSPAAPLVQNEHWIPGYITDTRIVGDVLYAVANQYAWYGYYYPNEEWSDLTHLLSIDLSDPDFIHEVDRLAFPRDGGWDNHVHVTPRAIYVASSHWGDSRYETTIRYVDISDPAGHMAIGAAVQVPGYVRDRWQMDEHDGVLRVALPQNTWNNSEPEIRTFRVRSPTDIRPLATLRLQLPRPEALTAVRFDGPKAYLVTYERVDPLFVVDLSVPEQPVQAGELQMSGWLDHLVPRGDRVVAFGHDDASGETHLAISLFDVSDPWNPTILDRVDVSGSWGWLTDERDNYDKLFKVLDAEGLVLLPFMQCGGDTWRCTGAVQLVDYNGDSLRRRGAVTHEGYIRRALMAGGRLMTLSDQRLQVLDISDRDHPVRTADLPLARSVDAIAVVNGVMVQLVGDWWLGDTRLLVLPLTDPDLGAPLAEIPLDAPYARLFTHGNSVFLLHRDYDQQDELTLTAVDLSDPAAPLVSDTLRLEGYDWWTYGYYWNWWWWGAYYPRADEAAQVGSTLVLHQVRNWGWCDDCESDRLLVVDLSDPYNLAGPVEVSLPDRDWVAGLQVAGDEVRFSHYRVSALQDPNGRPLARYYLNRLDVSDPAHPHLAPPVNVPGVLLGSDPSRGLVYTEDYQYAGEGYGFIRSLNVVALDDQQAVLRGRVTLPEDAGRILLSEATDDSAAPRRAWTVRNQWWEAPRTGEYRNASSLLGVDLSLDTAPALLPETPLPVPYASLYAVEGGYAVLGTWWYVSGILVYDVSGDAPSFSRHVRTQGWVSAVAHHGDQLYIATGPYGVLPPLTLR